MSKIFGRDVDLLSDLRNRFGKSHEQDAVDQLAADKIERLTAENERLIQTIFEVIGFVWSEACCRTDEGQDIGRIDIPDLLESIYKKWPSLRPKEGLRDE